MSEHLFVSPLIQGRWHEAFDDLLVVSGPAEAIEKARDDSLVWIDVTRPEWIARLRAARPALSLVALSLNPNANEGLWAFGAGVRGYCHALAAPQMLRQLAVVVTHGGLWLGAELMSRTAAAVARVVEPAATSDAASLDVLSPRERDVAMQVVGGASNKEIARRLDITPRTVKAHMGSIFEKLAVRDRLHLVLVLRRAGLTAAPEG